MRVIVRVLTIHNDDSIILIIGWANCITKGGMMQKLNSLEYIL